uniref:ABC-type branched-chain amino acid transport systems, periplasmic component n=1 Tax=uncultured Thiotrichaceae bacterium TaxID=298394 RepID=A0A6S6RVD9_9GAMM|nr:MAG: ABC-type branched-chain amino acid transport systems, periplasmic component [uncultured Thiotrichaceae bacterium]
MSKVGKNDHIRNLRKRLIAGFVIAGLMTSVNVLAEEGVTDSEIRLGTVLDLEGRSSALGTSMLKGMEAALKDKKISGRSLSLLSKNDSYTPDKTVAATQELIDQGVFLFMGNVGTPTAKVALPLLAEKKIPALGFFTGSGILRPEQNLIVNYRASYRQETAVVIKKALESGVKPTEVCAYVQNDAYGMAGVQGVLEALQGEDGISHITTALNGILEKTGENPKRNDAGPVGVYVRNTFRARDGYDSLKQWEKEQNTICRLVVTVGSYTSIGQFIAYANSKGEPWTYSAVSFTGADNLLEELQRFSVTDKVMMTQVVPDLQNNEAIVSEARNALGDDFNLISLEGFIVGKLLLHGLTQLEEKQQSVTRENFLKAYTGQQFDLDGLTMDFSNDNQGSDFIAITKLDKDSWITMRESAWQGWYKK